MFSKLVVAKCALLTTAVLALSGCANEDAEPFDKPAIKLKGARCLSLVGERMDDYLHGRSTPEEASKIWDCFRYALSTYSKYVRGEKSSRYHEEEIRGFLEDYFLENREISPAFAHEIMGLKRLFLGGSDTWITRRELAATKTLLVELEAVFLDLQPHIRVLLAVRDNPEERAPEPSRRELANAEQAVTRAVRRLFSLVKPETGRYEVSKLAGLIREIALFIKETRPQTDVGSLEKYVEVFAEAKALILNSSADVIEGHEWAALGEVFSRTADLGLRGYYGLRDLKGLTFTAPQLKAMDSLLARLQALAALSFSRRPDRLIPQESVHRVLQAAHKADLLPLAFTLEDLQKLTTWLGDKVLARGEQNPRQGWTENKINFLASEVRSWIYVQARLNNQFSNQEPKNFAAPSSSDENAWTKLQRFLNGPVSFSLDEHGRVVTGEGPAPTNLAGATRIHFLRSAFELVFRTYVEGGDDDLKLAKDELHTAYLDIQPVLVAMDLCERDDDTRDAKIFRDANLFMPRSDGDDTLSLVELVEYIHFVFSGIDAGHMLTDTRPPECRVGTKELQVSCFREAFRTQAPTYFAHLPKYQTYAASLSPTEWDRDIFNLEVSCRADGEDVAKKGVPILKTDIYEMFVFLHYVENVMRRFDHDDSKKLEIGEVYEAYDYVKNVLGGLLSLDPKEEGDELLALFTYLLKYGTVPDPKDPLMQIRYNHWKWHKSTWQIEVDRGQLLVVLASLQRL